MLPARAADAAEATGCATRRRTRLSTKAAPRSAATHATRDGADIVSAVEVACRTCADVCNRYSGRCRGKIRPLDPYVRDEAYRIAQEAFRNAVQQRQRECHRSGGHLWRQDIHLRIRDDGRVRFPNGSSIPSEAGIGVSGMRERAAAIKANSSVEREGAGTEIDSPSRQPSPMQRRGARRRAMIWIRKKGGHEY